MARKDLTDEEAGSRIAAGRPITFLELDEVTLERLCKSILALSSAHALGLEYNGVAPEAEDTEAAVAWFRDNSRSFREVCLAARVNATFARRVVLGRLSGAEVEV